MTFKQKTAWKEAACILYRELLYRDHTTQHAPKPNDDCTEKCPSIPLDLS